jgi:putative oxidoreductase
VFSNQGGGWEYPIFLIIVSVVLALLPAPQRKEASASVPAPAVPA